MGAKVRVMVAMSGGIDSSVTAMMLKDQGYDVVGATMKVWDYTSTCAVPKETGCCSLDSINDARSVAVKIGFPHFVFDLREEFEKMIITDFINEYMCGRTPNPCVLCNTHIKWKTLLKKADQMDCQFIATGHYARVREEGGRFVLSAGIDERKDQSYVLWGLSQENLSRTMFPLGSYTKRDIKRIAMEYGFKHIAEKRESFDICFIPDNDYRSFLNFKVENLQEKVGPGNFLSTDGKILGRHKGYPFYTVGQRKGLEIAVGHPLYVTGICPENNTVKLGTKEELAANTLIVRNYNLIKYAQVHENMDVITKIRYKDKGTHSRLKKQGDMIHVTFNENVSAIAPGQSAVFYENEDVVGGGIIC